MALLGKKKRGLSEIPSSSMADIAFLLLIFFMVSTTIDMDKGLSLILPAKGEQIEVRRKNIAKLLIDARGRVLLNNKEIEISGIKSEAIRITAENPKILFSVKTHSRTRYQTYINVIDQLKQANARRISIAE